MSCMGPWYILVSKTFWLLEHLLFSSQCVQVTMGRTLTHDFTQSLGQSSEVVSLGKILSRRGNRGSKKLSE